MPVSNTTREQAERFAAETGNGAHLPRALTGEEILELMRRAAPGANELHQRMKRDQLAGWSRARTLVLR